MRPVQVEKKFLGPAIIYVGIGMVDSNASFTVAPCPSKCAGCRVGKAEPTDAFFLSQSLRQKNPERLWIQRVDQSSIGEILKLGENAFSGPANPPYFPRKNKPDKPKIF